MKLYRVFLSAALLAASFVWTGCDDKEKLGEALGGKICRNGKCFTLTRFQDNIEAELKGKVVKYGYELRQGLAQLKGADGPKRTAIDPPAQNFSVNDRFNPASVTKVVTAVAMLHILNEKGISVDDSIFRYLPPTWRVPRSIQSITFAEVLNHTSGLRNGSGYTYSEVKEVVEDGINPADKVYNYENVNYALLRILLAKIDGQTSWSEPISAGAISSATFTNYINQNLLGPIGIANTKFEPASNNPTLFYPFPVLITPGTAYGDWSQRPGSAGIQLSVSELSKFLLSLYNGNLIPKHIVDEMESRRLGWFDYGVMNDGDNAYGHGGFFPGSWNGGAELHSAIRHFGSGVQATLVINGEINADEVLTKAYQDAWVTE